MFLYLVQIGSRITSKRICQFLEECAPFSYIMVDKHPLRHDPSHIVTHRIQTTIFDFVGCLLKATVPHTRNMWSTSLQLLSKMVLISRNEKLFLFVIMLAIFSFASNLMYSCSNLSSCLI